VRPEGGAQAQHIVVPRCLGRSDNVAIVPWGAELSLIEAAMRGLWLEQDLYDPPTLSTTDLSIAVRSALSTSTSGGGDG
jgi:hypothetical protein